MKYSIKHIKAIKSLNKQFHIFVIYNFEKRKKKNFFFFSFLFQYKQKMY